MPEVITRKVSKTLVIMEEIACFEDMFDASLDTLS